MFSWMFFNIHNTPECDFIFINSYSLFNNNLTLLQFRRLWISFATLPSVSVVISDSTSVLSVSIMLFKTRIIVSSIRHSCAMLGLICNVHGKVEVTSKCTFLCLRRGVFFQEHYANSGGTWCVFALFTYDCFRGKVRVCLNVRILP